MGQHPAEFLTGHMALIELQNISKSYDGELVLDEFDLKIKENEFITLLGPSGCGKTTTLRILGGFETPDTGKVLFQGQDITHLAPNKRQINTVFQKYALFPHMNIADNIAFGLKIKKLKKDEIDKKVRDIARKVDLSDEQLKKAVGQLSGGQQQRVAIARALVKMPRVLLLDEPLSNLDARLRLQTREEIRRIQKETKITTVFVTHDQEEAMSISDMIVVMKSGVVQQIGKPQDVYDNPANLFVANFLGTPPINIFTGHVKGERLFIGVDSVMDVPGVKDQDVFVGIRPEGFILDMANGTLCCKPQNVEVMGRDVSVVSTHEASQKPTVRSIIDADNKVDASADVVRYRIKPHKIFLFTRDDEGVRIPFEVK